MSNNLFHWLQCFYALGLSSLIVWALYTGTNRRARLVAGILTAIVLAVGFWFSPGTIYRVTHTVGVA